MALLGAYSLLSDMFLRDRSRVSQRVDRELRKRQREQVRKSMLFKDLGTTLATGATQVPAASPTMRARREAMIQQSGVSVTPHGYGQRQDCSGCGLAVACPEK